MKAGFNSADVGGLGSLAQIAEAAYVSMIGYRCTKIVPVTSNETARTFDKIGMLSIEFGTNEVSRISSIALESFLIILRILRGDPNV